MSKNTDLSELINYVKGASTGQLIAPSYISATSFTGTIAGYLGFDSSGNILTTGSASQWVTSGSNIYYNSGNVGIGTTSPTAPLDVTTSASWMATFNSTDANGGFIRFRRSGTDYGFIGSSYHLLTPAGPNNAIAISSSNAVIFGTGASLNERVRITSNGSIGIGTSAPIGDTASHISLTITNGATMTLALRSSATSVSSYLQTTGQGLLIYNGSDTGGISVTAKTQGVYLAPNGTSWSSLSDENLKTDLLPIENGLEKIVSLRALTGKYKTDANGISRSFLIAQDVQSVLPEAVTINANDGYLNLSYTDVIPLLVASIKELKSELDTLKQHN